MQELKELQGLEELSLEKLDQIAGGAQSVKQGIASFLAATSLLGSAANFTASAAPTNAEQGISTAQKIKMKKAVENDEHDMEERKQTQGFWTKEKILKATEIGSLAVGIPLLIWALSAGNELKQTSSGYKEISLDVDLETPGTDAIKFLKRFFDKDAPYYEKDEFGQTTGVIDHSSLTHPKKFEMIKTHLDHVENWENYPESAKKFYEKIDDSTFKFKCVYKDESENMGKKLYIYNTTFKVFRINQVNEINRPEIVKQIKKSNSIFELFDLKNKDGFFTIENVTGVINGMRAIDPEHYDMPVLDNCEIRQIDFQLQMHEFEQYFLDECCNYTFFNHDSGNGMFIAYWNYLTRGGRLYHAKKRDARSRRSCGYGFARK